MNSDDLGGAAPSLPLWASAPVAVMMFALLVLVVWRLRDRMAAFVIFAVWLRYILDAFHEITFRSSPAGMSWNALATFAMFGLGLLLIRRRNLLLKLVAPVYLLLLIATVSGLVNGHFGGLVNVILKYGYFVVILLGVYDSLDRLGDRFLPSLLVAFVPPLIFQLMSIALHVTKASEVDKSVSYIGGYVHEATFSVILATGLLVTCFARKLPALPRNGLVMIFIVAILMANYRTTILAMAPLIFIQFFTAAVGAVRREQRAFVAIASACLLLASLGLVGDKLAARFSDLGTVASAGDTLFKPSVTLTKSERQLLSGRIFIWNKYIEAYGDGPAYHYAFGFGPEVRVGGVDAKYAHNTLISILYEYGVVGVVAMLVLWTTMLQAALRLRSSIRVKLIAGHISFFLLNMATMPMWMVQGNILYGILCGYTLYCLRTERQAARERREAAALAETPPLHALPAE